VGLLCIILQIYYKVYMSTSYPSFKVTSGIISGSLPDMSNLSDLTRQQPRQQPRSAETPFMTFTNIDREVIGKIVIVEQTDGSSSIKFVKGPATGESSSLILNQTAINWTDTGINVEQSALPEGASENDNTLSIQYATNENDKIQIAPIIQTTSDGTATTSLSVAISRGNIEQTDPDTGITTNVAVVQTVNINAAQLTNIFENNEAGTNFSINVSSTGDSAEITKADETGSVLPPPEATVVQTVEVAVDNTSSDFALTPNCIITTYINDGAVTTRKLATDVQILMSTFQSYNTQISTFNSDIAYINSSINNLISINSDINTSISSITTDQYNISELQSLFNSDSARLSLIQRTYNSDYYLLTSASALISNNTTDISTIQARSTSDNNVLITTIDAFNTLSGLSTAITNLQNRVTNNEDDISEINTLFGNIQSSVSENGSLITSIQSRFTTYESNVVPIIGGLSANIPLNISTIGIFNTTLSNGNAGISDISQNNSDLQSTILNVTSATSELENEIVTAGYNLIIPHTNNIASNNSDIADNATHITALQTAIPNDQTQIVTLQSFVSDDHDTLIAILPSISDDHMALSTITSTVATHQNTIGTLSLSRIITDSTPTTTDVAIIPPTGNSIFYYTIGAGGGGGGGGIAPYNADGPCGGGGGGGSGQILSGSIFCTSDTVITYTIGSGGYGGSYGVGASAADPGSNGGNSTLSINYVTITANGGSGGLPGWLPGGGGAGGGGGQGGAGDFGGGGGCGYTPGIGGTGVYGSGGTGTVYDYYSSVGTGGTGACNLAIAISSDYTMPGGCGGGVFGALGSIYPTQLTDSGTLSGGGGGGSTRPAFTSSLFVSGGGNGGNGFISYYFKFLYKILMMVGPWMGAKFPIKKTFTIGAETVYVIEETVADGRVFTKMVSSNGTAKYYIGSIDLFDPLLWGGNTYITVPEGMYRVEYI